MSAHEAGQTVTSKCPSCGDEAERTVYDIGNGSGPELSCANCEWCWGANGQDLKPFTYDDMVREFGYDPMAKAK